MKSPRIKIAIVVLLFVFFGSLLAYNVQLPNADDMARHVKNGELIVRGDFDILTKNVYSYTEPEYRVVNHHWLAGVVYYLFHQIAGWGGLVILKILLLLVAFAVLFKTALGKSNFWLVAIFSVPTIIILMERTSLRPENFGYLFIALFMYLLLDLEKNPKSKKIWWLVPLQVLWVNMHIFFFVGVGLVGAFLVEKIIVNWKHLRHTPLVKKVSALLATLVAACFLNPNGLAGVLYPFNIFKSYGVDVSENQTLFEVIRGGSFWSDYALAWYPLIFAVLMASFLFGFKKKQKPIFYFLTSLAAGVAGFFLVRGITLFAFVFLPAIAYNLTEVYAWLKRRIAEKVPPAAASVIRNFFVIVLIVFIVFAMVMTNKKMSDRGIGLAYRSMDSAEFFKTHNLKGPIFNDYDAGSYLVYALFPEERVFLDNRPEAYSYDFLQDEYFLAIADERNWQAVLRRYNFNTIFFYQYDQGDGVRQFLWRRAHDSEWALVYVDIYNIIFVRNTAANSEVIRRFAITSENAEVRLAHLVDAENLEDKIAAADTFNLLGLDDLGTRTFLDVLSEDPDRPKLWMVLGQWELTKNDPRSPILAAMFLDKAISLGHKTAEAYSSLGAAYFRLDRPKNAKEALQKSLKINPNRFDAKELLDLIHE